MLRSRIQCWLWRALQHGRYGGVQHAAPAQRSQEVPAARGMRGRDGLDATAVTPASCHCGWPRRHCCHSGVMSLYGGLNGEITRERKGDASAYKEAPGFRPGFRVMPWRAEREREKERKKERTREAHGASTPNTRTQINTWSTLFLFRFSRMRGPNRAPCTHHVMRSDPFRISRNPV